MASPTLERHFSEHINIPCIYETEAELIFRLISLSIKGVTDHTEHNIGRHDLFFYIFQAKVPAFKKRSFRFCIYILYVDKYLK